MTQDLPKTIYKYRSWNSEFGKRVLTDFELYLASPGEFNDPFDAKVPYNFQNLSNEELDKVIGKFAAHSPKHRRLNQVSPRTSRRIIKKLYTSDPNWLQSLSNKIDFEAVDKLIGVVSMSANWDNQLMWAHYSDNHKGYCIGFNEIAIKNSGKFKYGGLIQYAESSDFPKISPLDQSDKAFYEKTFTKSIDWKYEQEYRLLKIFQPPNGPTHQQRIIKIDPDSIVEVIVGMKMPEKDRSSIMEICKKHKIKVFEAKPVPLKFELSRELLQHG
jgi:hypothetical protein